MLYKSRLNPIYHTTTNHVRPQTCRFPAPPRHRSRREVRWLWQHHTASRPDGRRNLKDLHHHVWWAGAIIPPVSAVDLHADDSLAADPLIPRKRRECNQPRVHYAVLSEELQPKFHRCVWKWCPELSRKPFVAGRFILGGRSQRCAVHRRRVGFPRVHAVC